MRALVSVYPTLNRNSSLAIRDRINRLNPTIILRKSQESNLEVVTQKKMVGTQLRYFVSSTTVSAPTSRLLVFRAKSRSDRFQYVCQTL
jgi:hypothetical protein